MLNIKNTKMSFIAAVWATVGMFCQPLFAEQVDLLLLYDDYTENRYNGAPVATMNAWVDNANAAYAASQVDIQLNLVGLELFNPSSTDISSKLSEIRGSATVDRLRTQYGADFVSLIASADGGTCGIGYLSVSSRSAFNVSGIQCGYLTLTHELGHNMGLGHSRRQGSRGARYDYGLGYGVDNEFATIMAYPSAFSTRTRLNRFSDPNRTCEGLTCGVPIGASQAADAHTALNNVRFDVANFRDNVGGTTGGGTDGGTDGSTPVTVPAPSNLNSTAQEQNITIVWQDNSTGEDYFEIQRSTSAASGFANIATTGRGISSYTDSNLAENQRYYYRVRANLTGVNSDWSNVTNATTAGPVIVDVPAPSNLTATAASDSSINVTWSDNSTNEDFFAIQRSSSSNNGFEQAGTVGRGNTSFIDQDLSPGTYYYRVQASKQNVLSDWTATASATINGSTEPTVPPVSGMGLNLLDLGFRVYSTQRGSDARGYITQDGSTIALFNNLWAASTTTFEITPSTILSFDYSSDVSGEIHGIGMEENDQPSSNRIFKLGGTQNWGINDFEYTGNGASQHFDIPIGQYYTGNMRLVVANDNDAGTGNSGYFSNISLSDQGQDVISADTANIVFGLDYIDDHTATLFHKVSNQADLHNELCVNGDCARGDWNNGRLERQLNVSINESYLIEFRLQKDHDECTTSTIVTYGTGKNGEIESPCL